MQRTLHQEEGRRSDDNPPTYDEAVLPPPPPRSTETTQIITSISEAHFDCDTTATCHECRRKREQRLSFSSVYEYTGKKNKRAFYYDKTTEFGPVPITCLIHSKSICTLIASIESIHLQRGSRPWKGHTLHPTNCEACEENFRKEKLIGRRNVYALADSRNNVILFYYIQWPGTETCLIACDKHTEFAIGIMNRLTDEMFRNATFLTFSPLWQQ